ncbi:intradiol ring-cleavage dioxygenase [Chloroflexus sp.]|uniref:intradiol ring-cleavage dioxygenase n=1 Tax=Chloroflexus sp. TaxID=1904827 RepID=UPI002627EB40|nr:intradiol ring-cleavage dioxygenase [uncultured Chloroflexus sp.]
MSSEERDLFDLGLQADLTMMQQPLLTRRRLLRLGLIGITTFLAGCTPMAEAIPTPTTSTPAARSTASPTTAITATTAPTMAAPATATTVPTVAPTSVAVAECVEAIPPETAGPFPGNGSQGTALNVLTRSGVVRSDIRTSLGTGNIADGIPLRLELKLVRAGGDCAPLPGYAIYLWHCDAPGRYSMYSSGVEGEDYLRGVQAADEQGLVVFQTIFPGCYAGRWPHMHFEIYPSLEQATSARNVAHTSQLALPADICRQVYADSRYGNSLRNLGQLSLERDGIFRDGWETQMATVTGSLNEGLMARLTVGVPGA